MSRKNPAYGITIGLLEVGWQVGRQMNCMHRRAGIALLCALLTGFIGSWSTAQADPVKSAPVDDAGGPAYQITTIAEGLDFPWDLTFLPDGNILITERSGQLRIIREGTLDPMPIEGVPETYVARQGGLFETLLHPDFEANRFIYVSFAYGTPKQNATRIVRAEFTGSELINPEVVFTVEPFKDTPVHYGGRMAFLPDGTLVMTTGDGFNYREEAQKLDTLLGKVIRINDDGSVPTDNPFVGQPDAKPQIWTYGHRNSQGLVYDPATERLYLNEHGALGGDELNVLEKGKNYGWPVITYGKDYSGAMISPFTEMEGMEQPILYWVPSIAPSGMDVYSGDKFPDWAGDIFVSALAGQVVERIDMENGQVAGSEKLFEELGERFRDVRQGPDGYLYLLTDSPEGRVLRIEPASAQ